MPISNAYSGLLLYLKRLGQEPTGNDIAAGAELEGNERDERAEETILLVEVALRLSTEHKFDNSSVMNIKAPDSFAALCALQLGGCKTQIEPLVGIGSISRKTFILRSKRMGQLLTLCVY